MERNINNINREPFFNEVFSHRVVGDGFFSDLTKKLVSSAGEKAASAIGAKAGEALGNKFFNRQKNKSKISKEAPKAAGPSALAVEENKGSELVKLLQVENKLQSANPQSNIHEIYNRLLNPEGSA